MDNTVWALVVPVVLAALGAVTTVAYKHPKAYERLGPALIISLFAVILGIVVWDLSPERCSGCDYLYPFTRR